MGRPSQRATAPADFTSRAPRHPRTHRSTTTAAMSGSGLSESAKVVLARVAWSAVGTDPAKGFRNKFRISTRFFLYFSLLKVGGRPVAVRCSATVASLSPAIIAALLLRANPHSTRGTTACNFPRFRSLKAFGRRPRCMPHRRNRRHPKPSTSSSAGLACIGPLCLDLQSGCSNRPSAKVPVAIHLPTGS